MSSINKFHSNGSTILSLNERFTRMQHTGGGQSHPQRRVEQPFNQNRSRSRSRSRPRIIPQQPRATIAPRTTLRNRSLLQQLDQKHILRAALKLKRRSLKMKPRNTIGAGRRRQLIRPNTGTLNTTLNTRRRNRSTSVAKQIATIKADLVKNIKRVRRLTRTNSTTNLNQQIGGARGRPRLKRNNINARAASRARSVSRNRTGLTRANSTQNLRERSASRQRAGAPIRLKRTNQIGSNGGGAGTGQRRNRPLVRRQQLQQQQQQPKRGRSRSNVRSINSRLQGVKRQNNNQTGRKPRNNSITQIKRGRITKRNGQQNPQQQRGRLLSRNGRGGNQLQRNNNNQRGGQKQNKNQQFRNQGRGRNANKAVRGRNPKVNVKREPAKSKEQLDAELDQYMVNTKPNPDQEFGIYSK